MGVKLNTLGNKRRGEREKSKFFFFKGKGGIFFLRTQHFSIEDHTHAYVQHNTLTHPDTVRIGRARKRAIHANNTRVGFLARSRNENQEQRGEERKES